MATPKDYSTAVNATNAWLQKYAGMYAGMIPQSYIQAISKSVVDAVDAERATAGAKATLHAPPEGAPLMGGSMLVEMALGMIPWDNMADKDAMRAQIPTASDMIQIVKDNRVAIQNFIKDWQTAGPPISAAARAIAKMEK